MKISLDAREWRQTETGPGRYASNLVEQIVSADRTNEYVVLRLRANSDSLKGAENTREIPVSFGMSSMRNQLAGARVINSLDLDVYHALFHFLPLGVRAKRIVLTLHDLIWVEHASLAAEAPLRQWMKRMRGGPFIGRALRRADHVIAVSEATRQAALSRFSLPAEKVSVIYHGVDPVFRGPVVAPLPEVCRGRRFVFALGTSKPYKNIGRLIRAFAIISADFPDLFLVITGRAEAYPTLSGLAADLAIGNRVVFADRVSDAQIRSCFEHADFFAFPSIVEGFGLPVIEAMAAGCAVLTSNRSSLAEISGDAAHCVDVLEVDALAAGMRRLLTDDELCRQLVARGLEKSREFTWERSAAQTLDVYRRVMDS